MATRQRAKIGFIGAGNFVSAHHLLTVRDSERMEIAAIADLDEARLAKHQSQMQIGYVTTDYKKLLADPDIDIVIIGTKQNLHAKMIIESLDAGKWVLCEKPMAETEEDCQAVLAAEKRNKGKLAIGFNRRFAPAYIETKRLMKDIPRPWYINYRLMYPNPEKSGEKNFYSDHPRILYEGCHILDLVSWMLEDVPVKVFMTGDRILNNCCIMEYQDGSQVSFMCGSMGSYCLWKEYMEIFGKYTAITVQDFTDMRVRGIPGGKDMLFAPHMGEHAAEVLKWGFDFYELYKSKELMKNADAYKQDYDMFINAVQRPLAVPFDVEKYNKVNPDLWGFIPDKGWTGAIENFAACFLEGRAPENADGKAGRLSTEIALGLLKSLETGLPVTMGK